MKIEIHIHHHAADPAVIHYLERIVMQLSEAQAQIEALTQQAVKAKAEVVQKIADLEAAVATLGQTTPEFDSALVALKGAVQGVDDVVPDAPPVP